MTDSNADKPAEIPRVPIEDIAFVKFVGRGTYGSVYRATWHNHGEVAVKKMTIGEGNYFDIEVKQLSRVEHPNIIKLLGVASDQDFNFIILEYADGGSLEKFLHGESQREYTRQEALSWAQQCAKGVAYLHSQGPKPLLHRDLKPANLLLTNNESFLKICDFGSVAEKKTQMTNNKGSAAYMAPEVMEGTNYNEKCDVYSWAIVFWEILTREVPYKSFEKSFQIIWSVQTGKRPALSEDWPITIKEILTKCWKLKADDRPTMQEVWQQIIEISKTTDEP